MAYEVFECFRSESSVVLLLIPEENSAVEVDTLLKGMTSENSRVEWKAD